MERYTLDQAEALSGPQQVAYYNETLVPALQAIGLPVTPTKRFSDRKKGAKAIVASYEDLDAGPVSVKKTKAKKSPKAETSTSSKKPAKAKAKKEAKTSKAKTSDKPKKLRQTGSVNSQPLDPVLPAVIGSKQSILVDTLFRKEGATLAELMEAMSHGKRPWKEITAKSSLNWDVHSCLGYGVRTEFLDADQLRATGRAKEAKNLVEGMKVACYHLRLPEGMRKPLAHITRAEKLNWKKR